MKLTNAKFDLIIDMRENKVDVLVIENATIMSEIVEELYKQSSGEEGNFILSENNKDLKFEKNFALIINPFAVDFNDKKIINKLFSELSAIGNEFVVEKMQINSEIGQLLEKIISDAQYNNISYNLDFDWNNLFKLYGVKIEYECDTLLEKMIGYIKIVSGLCSIKAMCLVNIKSFLNNEEIKQLYEMAFYYKIQLLLIESCERNNIPDENIYIIDKDRCLIIK